MMQARRARPWAPALLIVLVLAVLGCEEEGPTGPTSSPPLSGAWTGTIVDPAAGTGRLDLTLDQQPVGQAGSVVFGKWTVTFGNAARNNSGMVSGTVLDTDARLELNPNSRPACSAGTFPFSTFVDGYSLTVPVSATRLVGASRFYRCTDALAGTVDLGR